MFASLIPFRLLSWILPALFLVSREAPAGVFEMVLPEIPGIEAARGESVPIPGPTTALAFQFEDGRIVVGKGNECAWSFDGGHNWENGPAGPSEKVALDLGQGEILAIERNSQRRPDGLLLLKQRRSLDNWRTVTDEEALLDLPQASYTVTGDGSRIDGFLFHHGLLQLSSGDLIGTMYGNLEGDTMLCDGYPPELNQRKYRTVVVFSKDKGRTWGNPVLVAYDAMLGRGIPEDHEMVGRSIPESLVKPTAIVPAITQEGFREADLVEAPNGDLVCVMRTGGRNGGTTTLFPTPLYCSRSEDGGRSWSPPEQIADRGVCPNLVALDNGIIVCAYSRPGNWLIFSDDNGRTWRGAIQFGETRDYVYIIKTGPETVQVFHETVADGRKLVRGTYFDVRAK